MLQQQHYCICQQACCLPAAQPAHRSGTYLHLTLLLLQLYPAAMQGPGSGGGEGSSEPPDSHRLPAERLERSQAAGIAAVADVAGADEDLAVGNKHGAGQSAA